MKVTAIRLAAGLCLLALASTSAWALPPACDDVCEYRPARYHCSNFPFGTITCGEWCTNWCPGCCDLFPAAPFLEAASWQEAEASEASLAKESEKALKPASPPEEPVI